MSISRENGNRFVGSSFSGLFVARNEVGQVLVQGLGFGG